MLYSLNARTGESIGQVSASSLAEVDGACEAAAAASDAWQASTGAQRAALLHALATALESEREALVAVADSETALGPTRLNGELDRTAFQLRRFAQMAAQGTFHAVLDDPAVPGAPAAGHPAMQRRHVALGPVAVFSASNFPFAFSVLGGDTASALAAGCPVVVKAHSGHLLTSQHVWGLAQQVLAQQKLPAALLAMVQDGGFAVGCRLITHPAIAAGAFTGSTKGGAALAALAAARPRPVPFFGELGSVNPVVALPQRLAADTSALAQVLASSITLGCGQFCTSPGLLLLLDEPLATLDAAATNSAFAAQLARALREQPTHPMLTPGMRQAFDGAVAQWQRSGVECLAHEATPPSQPPRPVLGLVSAQQFLAQEPLRHEVFGPACLVVRAAHRAELLQVLDAVGGSLTVTLWGVEQESDWAASLVRKAMNVAGRVLFSGVPTGVAVSAAQQHGGPWPSSTRSESTSVGDAAWLRFVRPVCLQDAPHWLR
ncbi:MAG: aldehyde dehydrogenase family protein [Rhodoferax sp.]